MPTNLMATKLFYEVQNGGDVWVIYMREYSESLRVFQIPLALEVQVELEGHSYTTALFPTIVPLQTPY